MKPLEILEKLKSDYSNLAFVTYSFPVKGKESGIDTIPVANVHFASLNLLDSEETSLNKISSWINSPGFDRLVLIQKGVNGPIKTEINTEWLTNIK